MSIDPKNIMFGGKRVGDMTIDECIVVIGQLNHQIEEIGGWISDFGTFGSAAMMIGIDGSITRVPHNELIQQLAVDHRPATVTPDSFEQVVTDALNAMGIEDPKPATTTQEDDSF